MISRLRAVRVPPRGPADGPRDLEQLEQLLATDSDHLSDDDRSRFADMRDKLLVARGSVHGRAYLTEPQRCYLEGVRTRLQLADTDVSTGRVEIGAPVETLAVLRKLPLKPPGRK